MSYWPLVSLLLLGLGFLLRVNTAITVVGAALVSGLASGRSVLEVLALLGEAIAQNRALLLFVLTLPAIGVLERAGLREHARAWVERMRGLSLARLLVSYLALRQLSSMLGLTYVAGHAQTVRPLLSPMCEAAARRSGAGEGPGARAAIRAMAAATDNVGLFFGEDVFVAIGGVLLVQAFWAEHDIELEPLEIALWAAPTAVAAFVIHAARIVRFERTLRAGAPGAAAETPPEPASSTPRDEALPPEDAAR